MKRNFTFYNLKCTEEIGVTCYIYYVPSQIFLYEIKLMLHGNLKSNDYNIQ